MIYLYHGGGASITDISGETMSAEGWKTLRSNAVRLLSARRQVKAADALNKFPFELLNATNYFLDEFAILRLTTGMEQYVALTELQNDRTIENPFHEIAKTIDELGTYVRFVVLQLQSEDATLPVAPPSPQVTTEAVERALADAELLLRSRGPEHALDRVHTAVHGYLRAVLERHHLPASQTATATELFKTLREAHEPLRELGARGNEIKRLIMALATILDSMGTLRNNASGAHPNPVVLDPPEAMLAINAARSLLHYLDQRV
jgi:hypothetical protein